MAKRLARVEIGEFYAIPLFLSERKRNQHLVMKAVNFYK